MRLEMERSASPQDKNQLHVFLSKENAYRIAIVNGLPFYQNHQLEFWYPISGIGIEGEGSLNPEIKVISPRRVKHFTNWAHCIAHDIKLLSDELFQIPQLLKTDTEYDDVLTEEQLIANFIDGFRSMEALLISMKISERWEQHSIFQKIKTHVLMDSRCKKFFDSNDFSDGKISVVEGNTLKNSEDNDATIIRKANQWLKEKVEKNSNYVPFVYKNSKLKPRGLLAVSIIAGVIGGLILGNILNIGLLSGTGGLILAGLSTLAAATGFGLITISAVLFVGLIGFAAYNSYKFHKHYRNLLEDEGFEKFEYEENSAATRATIVKELIISLNATQQHSQVAEEKPAEPTNLAAPKVSNKPSFFSRACNALRCCARREELVDEARHSANELC